MKYIVVEVTTKPDGGLTMEIPFIFPNRMVHGLMVTVAAAAVQAHGWTFQSLISAGDISVGGANCGGESTSTGVASRGDEDVNLILMNDYGAGIR